MKRVTGRVYSNYTYAVTLLALLSCKPVAKQGDLAQTKTIDNLAAGKDVVENNCSGPYQGDNYSQSIEIKIASQDASRKAALLASVNKALTAVPSGLKKFYFEAGKGTIVITDSIAQDCQGFTEAKIFASQETVKVACQDPKTIQPRILIQDDEKSIAHETVRLFAYTIAGMGYVASASKSTDDSRLQMQIFGFFIRSWQENLTEAFVADLKKMQGDPYTQVLAEIENARTNQEKLSAIQTMIFADAFDSQYCSDVSRANFKAPQFSSTYKTFQQFAGNEVLVKMKGLNGANEQFARVDWRKITGEQPIQQKRTSKSTSGFSLDDYDTEGGYVSSEGGTGGQQVAPDPIEGAGTKQSAENPYAKQFSGFESHVGGLFTGDYRTGTWSDPVTKQDITFQTSPATDQFGNKMASMTVNVPEGDNTNMLYRAAQAYAGYTNQNVGALSSSSYFPSSISNLLYGPSATLVQPPRYRYP